MHVHLLHQPHAWQLQSHAGQQCSIPKLLHLQILLQGGQPLVQQLDNVLSRQTNL